MQPAALVFGKEVLGTDLVGVFGNQPTFTFDPRRPDRLDRIVSIGYADKAAGRVVDDDQGLERDQRRNCEQLLQVVDGARQGVVEVDVEGVEVEQIKEFESAGRTVGEGFQVGEAVTGVDMHPLADQGQSQPAGRSGRDSQIPYGSPLSDD